MGFDNGSIAITVCKLITLPEDIFKVMSGHKAQPLEMVGRDIQYGFTSGRHLLDTNINEDTCHNGQYIYMNVRAAQRKASAALVKAECQLRECAEKAERSMTFLPRKEKSRIKKEVEKELSEKAMPTIKGIPFVIDQNNGMIYIGTASLNEFDQVAILFDQVGIDMVPEIDTESTSIIKSAEMAPIYFSESHQLEMFSYFMPDFLTWLWYYQEKGNGFHVGTYGEFYLAIEGPMTFKKEDGAGALLSTVKKGGITTSAEALGALQDGKKISSCRYIICRDEQCWYFTLSDERLSFKCLKLPHGEELEPVSSFEERMLFIEIFRQCIITLIKIYVNQVSDGTSHHLLQGNIYNWLDEKRASIT